MAGPVFTVAVGAIDGVNVFFFTPTPYTPGTLAVFLNGVLLRKDYDNGWIDINPVTGAFETKEAPRTADTLQVFYLDTSSSTATSTEVTKITASIKSKDEVVGAFKTISSVSASLKEKETLSAAVKEISGIQATIKDVDRITATVKEC